jgi:RND family efflux transporter MFP subunit
MTKLRLLVLSSVIASGGFLAGRLAPSLGTAQSAAPATARKVLYWHDPMHPAYRSDRPGIAPDCGMQLEPVYADGGPAGATGAPARPAGTVTIDGALRQLQGIAVAPVQRAASVQSLRLLGRVTPDERRVFSVNAAMEGSIRALSSVTAGSFVQKDQWLGAFFSADIRTPLQAYITALDVIGQDPLTRAQLGTQVAAGSSPGRNARFAVERLRALGMSPRQLERLAVTREIPLTVDILAPTDGLVLARGVTLGQKFEKGMEWFRIANLDRVWIIADLAEMDADLARPGARARVSLPGRPGALTATVSDVPPRFDATARTMKVRLELDNPGAALRPDMFVDVDLEISRPAALVIPADALVDVGVRRLVFVEAGEGVYEPREVELGWRHGDRIEVVRGLEAGERIVVSGTFLVDSESRIRSAAVHPPAESHEAVVAHEAAEKDPVCGMAVDAEKARAAGHAVEHDGRTHYFCSDGCQAAFLASPGKFAARSDRGDHADHADDAGNPEHADTFHARAGRAP